MQLPRDNAITLPEDNELVLDAGDDLGLTDAEILALLPGWVRGRPSALRDALVRATRGYWTKVQARIGRALGALQSPRNATGLRLADHGEMRRRPRASMETESAYRERLLTRPRKITPNAIRETVTALVLARTPTPPVVFEPGTEGVFVQDVDTPDAWMCFLQPAAGPILWADMPDNLIRAGVWVGPEVDVTRAVFVVFIEGPLYDLPDQFHVLPEGAAAPSVAGLFVGTAATPAAWAYFGSEVPPLDEQVMREVESRRGAGVVWWLYVLPNLGGAL